MKKILLFFVCLPIFSSGQIITTLAGNGSTISSGDGGQATAAGIEGPGGVVFDAVGNMYVAEYTGHKVRKVTPSGIISTIAGNGVSGYTGDGGPATAALVSRPSKILIDATHNIYFADIDNNCVRKISSTGIISTVAGNGTGGFSGDGGAATAAHLFHPTGVALDASGNLYIADYDNNAVRKVNAISGIITTIAGTGVAGNTGDGGMATAAKLHQPWGVTLDGTGNIYIADMVNHRIRVVAPSGIITNFAGTGTPGFFGDGGPATAAQFYQPADVLFDQSGNTYIADQLNNRTRKISSTGIITTVAGNGTPGYFGDGGPATAAEINSSNDITFDTAWHLVICDNTNNRIRVLGNCPNYITLQPVHDTVPEGTDAIYSVTTTMPSPVYQWQGNTGTGFVNLANIWPYSGVTTSTLTIHNASMFLNSAHFRCFISDGSPCVDTSFAAILIVHSPTDVTQVTSESINVYPNPTYNDLTLYIPGQNLKGSIQIINELGQVVYQQNIDSNNSRVNLKNLPIGMYMAKIQLDDKIIYKKIFKN
jgi:Secretion system C-terminal sorting domain/NHL repeat